MQKRTIGLLLAMVAILIAMSSCRGSTTTSPEAPLEMPTDLQSAPATLTPTLPQEESTLTTSPESPPPAITPQTTQAFPTPTVLQIDVAEQPFENGWMFALLERGEIWVAIFTHTGGGQWLTFPDEFVEGSPELDSELTPPAGLVQPIRGFGLVWREGLTEEQRQSIGWATWPEIGYTTTYRYEPGGYIDPDGDYIPRPGQHVIINWGGDVFTFDEAPSSFSYTSSS